MDFIAALRGYHTLLAATVNLLPQQRAYILATALHETGTLQPVHERGTKQYFDRYEPSTPIGKQLGNALHGDGYRFRGRGYVQLTGRRNYVVAGSKLGHDFVAKPDDTLRPEFAPRIIVDGMMEGWFTGRRLDRYINKEKVDYRNARRVVNGNDKAEAIAKMAQSFESLLYDSKLAPHPFLVAEATVPPPLDIEQPGVMPTRWWTRLMHSMRD